MSVENRVTELETRLAFQDDTIQALNEVLIDQQRQLERLGLQLAQLTERYRELAGQYGEAGDEPPPPHY
ncbi:SlyX family protein [Pseudomonas sp. RIT-PI-S]|uniref:SlyX family protein n=1 Tax=Pseudomonas sp. RIT-PI-S TaxID=3035295 RepID=UPI0021D8C3FC|nr:SlyX family protein [Pseudomonas sp. RIT-PI-S]